MPPASSASPKPASISKNTAEQAAAAAAPAPQQPQTPARRALIDALEKLRGSRVICFATGDRGQQEIQIGQDVLPKLYEHLTQIGHVPRLDLVLYSRGGHTLTGFALANALREFADQVAIVVPFRAHSCATLIALGADEILMGPFGELSPIDPSITTPHGPYVEEGGKRAYIPVSVEDVANYFELARKEGSLTSEESMRGVVAHLTAHVNPLALGAVYRAREQIGMLAEKLLSLHITDKSRRGRIVSVLTRELLSHDYVLSRREAKQVGMPVVDASDDEARVMWGIYEDVAAELKLNDFFNPAGMSTPIRSSRGVLESASLKHTFVTNYRVIAKGTDTTLDVLSEGWERV